MTRPLCSVVTTIQPPTDAVRALASRLGASAGTLVVVGDGRGPHAYDVAGAQLWTLADQLASPFGLARRLPVGHYARKNVGYLAAIAAGAGCIYETDDDNAPLASWAPRPEVVEAAEVVEAGWVNAYRLFTDETIWPRGFPLDAVRGACVRAPLLAPVRRAVRAPIQQGLANHAPDVDAVWRLVLDRPFDFVGGESVVLPRGAWCPFNSQSTWWWPAAYPLLYLPSHCSFRMTDIWRGFVAQRCLWEMDAALVFHAPEVVQERNAHDLMRDFADEVPGYTRNREIAEVLGALWLRPGEGQAGENLRRCYEALVAVGVFPPEELALVDAWLADLAALAAARPQTAPREVPA